MSTAELAVRSLNSKHRSLGVTLIRAIAGAILVLIAAANVIAPATPGHRLMYYVVVGSSMEPLLRGGDLALLVRAQQYNVGDVVAYRDPALGVVLHRIRDITPTGFVAGGINRPDADSYQPTAEDIEGKLWVRVPQGGAFLRSLREPRNAWPLIIATIAFSLVPPAVRRRSPGDGETPGLLASLDALSIQTPAGQKTAVYAVVALVASGGIGLFMQFADPAREAFREAAIEQTGTWSYGDVTVGDGVYDGNRLTTGQPVFLALNRVLPLRFRYATAPLSPADEIHDVRGTVQVTAELTAVNKWSRSLELLPPTPFTGDEIVAESSLDIAQLRSIAASVEKQTDVTFGTYQVTVTARVRGTAAVGQQPVEQTLTAPIAFDLTTQQLIPTGDPAVPINALTKISRPILVAWTGNVPVLAWQVSYPQLQLLAFVFGVAGLLGAGVVGYCTFLTRSSDEGARIRARHGSVLVSGIEMPDFAGPVVPVKSFGDLLRVAAQDETCILDVRTEFEDKFVVFGRSDKATFVYRAPRRDSKLQGDARVRGHNREADPSFIESLPNLLAPSRDASDGVTSLAEHKVQLASALPADSTGDDHGSERGGHGTEQRAS